MPDTKWRRDLISLFEKAEPEIDKAKNMVLRLWPKGRVPGFESAKDAIWFYGMEAVRDTLGLEGDNLRVVGAFARCRASRSTTFGGCRNKALQFAKKLREAQ